MKEDRLGGRLLVLRGLRRCDARPDPVIDVGRAEPAVLTLGRFPSALGCPGRIPPQPHGDRKRGMRASPIR